jgi:RNA polymerase II elongation factor ELL
LSERSNVDFDSEDLDMETDSDSNSAGDLLKDSTSHYILKDKSYKEFQPWNWTFYSLFERKLIQQNIHRALTRLGYSESHPLRRKICAENTSSEDDKKSTLGGGFLISKTNGKKNSDLPKITTAKVEKRQPSSIATQSTSISPVRPQTANSKLTVNKRKFSSSSISSSDEEKQLKKLKQDYDTSPSSEEDNVPLSRRNEVKNDIPEHNPPETKSASKRLGYYNNLAAKFKIKYTEYEMLYKQLKNPNLSQNKVESKKSLLKLFELHNSLSQWKKTLWDYDNEIKRKSKIMNLSKHKKNGSGNATTVTKNLKVSDDLHGYQSSSPAPGSKPQSPTALRSTHSQSTSSAPRPGSTPATVPLKQRPKFSLNY